jgi:RNA polymerase primary sigma factor
MNDMIPNDVCSPEDLDDVLATIGTLGIDVLERQPKLPSSVLKRKFGEEVEPGGDLGLDLAPGAVEQINDPVRIGMSSSRPICASWFPLQKSMAIVGFSSST